MRKTHIADDHVDIKMSEKIRESQKPDDALIKRAKTIVEDSPERLYIA